MMENSQVHKYLHNDNIFCEINKKFVSLNDDEVKRVNRYLHEIVKILMERMKLKDSLFQKMYQQIIFCGSFYKGTKVGKPNEFDLNITLKLPVNVNYIQFYSTEPGFVKICIKSDSRIYNLSDIENRSFQKLISNNHIDQDKLRQWTESLITKVTNELPMNSDGHELTVRINDGFGEYFCFNVKIKLRKSGPAFTLILNIPNEAEKIYIDLAPALIFDISMIKNFTPKFHVLQNCRNNVFFAIPVPLSTANCITDTNLHWRLSFFLQENEILTKYGRVKPVIRQMKKLRDVQNWKSIASYYIEILFLNEMAELKQDLKKIPLTLLLFIMIKKLCYTCKQHELKFFWNKNYNLFKKIGQCEMFNIAQRLENIIKDIENNAMTNSLVLAKYILTPFELQSLCFDESVEDFNNSSNSNDKVVKDSYHRVVTEVPKDSKQQSTCMIL